MTDSATLGRYLRKVTGELRDARRRLEELEGQTGDPVAIIGMSCRFPGGVCSPEELWLLLREGRDGIDEFPADRDWDLGSFFDSDPDRPGASYVREGGFLDGATEFDADFFDIPPREALAADPQQRLLLEGAWEALEDAGLDPTALRGESAGVFAGVMRQDYDPVRAGALDLEAHRPTGISASVVAGRVSYALGLIGPALAVDTACSSSLVAIHLAAGALRAGECRLALAGGVTVMAEPSVFAELSRQRGAARDGRCKSFAEAADGTGFSEGMGLVVLERLADAEAAGHEVLAVIRGSAVNQDGASNGLTAPNGPSQERLIRRALECAGLGPADVDMVEAHGTGTTLGDPIEAGALLATYGQGRQAPLRLGSVKSNIGHTQAAAGVAGVIKAVLAMREGTMPKTLHLDAPSSQVEWGSGRVELLDEPLEWEANGRPRRAGISSFGISGTNAHLILEQGPEPRGGEERAGGMAQPPLGAALPLVLSAKSAEALRESAERLGAHLEERPEQGLADTAFSLTARAGLEHRAVAVASERSKALEALAAIAAGEDHPAIARGLALESQAPVFVFPGQGSQWRGMAAGLIEESPLFEQQIAECEAALEPYLDFPLRPVLSGAPDAAAIERIEVVQPALFATMVALARLWEACGVRPAATIGHSQGEIAAAHLAGGLSLEDAARIAALRSRLIARLAGQGAMLSVALGAGAMESLIAPFGEAIEIAACNGPSSTILSARREAADELLARCEAEEIRAKEIAATIPSHSAMVEPLREELLEALAPISPQSGEVPFHSTVTGERLDTAGLTPEYWYRNLRLPVLFEGAIRGLAEAGQAAFVEISPHPVFALPIQETLEASLAEPERAAVTGTLRREDGGAKRFCLSLAEAHAAGAEIEWPAFFEGADPRRVALPTYPFQRRRYWLAAGASTGDPGSIGLAGAEHPLLGAALEDPAGERLTLTGRLSLSTHPWLADHAVAGTALLPGTAFLELALQAAERVGAEQVAELTLREPLVLPEAGAIRLQVCVEAPEEQGARALRVFSRPEAEAQGEWMLHAEGLLCAGAPAPAEGPSEWPPQGAEPLEAEFLYDRLAEAGFEYGPAFQGLTAAWRRGEEIFCEASLSPEQGAEAERCAIHPALLDSALHAILLAGLAGGEAAPELRLPFSWSGVRLEGSGATELRVAICPAGEAHSLRIADGEGAPLARVESLSTRPLSPSGLAGARGEAPLAIEWRERSLEHTEAGHEVELHRCEPEQGIDPPEAARRLAGEALEAIQGFLRRSEPSPEARMAILTRGAVSVDAEGSPDPAAAAVWGLVRCAQAEHPERFLLIDTDGSDASAKALPTALAQAEEPQLALRAGVALAPRAARLPRRGRGEARPLDPDRTVLISGATGALGMLLARHLVGEHGARRLLLASRSGAKAPGAAQLRSELEELGAEVRIAACDVSDEEQLKALLAAVPAEHPPGAVFHLAGALADATVEALSPESLDAVLAPKADAAWALAELTEEAELTHFVLYSSAAGALGSPGQGNYAAAGCFCDALAQGLRARGRQATSIAWGHWRTESAMSAGLGEAGLERLRRAGIASMSDEQGLALLDSALASGRACPLALALEPPALRRLASLGVLAPMLSELIRAPRRRGRGGRLAHRLAALQEAERLPRLTELVRAEAAAVLGHRDAAEVDPERAFSELGFDSLAALELRNRLGALAGVRLAPTVVFDHPSARRLAEWVLGEMSIAGGRDAEAELDGLERSLASLPGDAPGRARIAVRLRAIATGLEANGAQGGSVTGESLARASDEELLEFIDAQVGGGVGRGQ